MVRFLFFILTPCSRKLKDAHSVLLLLLLLYVSVRCVMQSICGTSCCTTWTPVDSGFYACCLEADVATNKQQIDDLPCHSLHCAGWKRDEGERERECSKLHVRFFLSVFRREQRLSSAEYIKYSFFASFSVYHCGFVL